MNYYNSGQIERAYKDLDIDKNQLDDIESKVRDLNLTHEEIESLTHTEISKKLSSLETKIKEKSITSGYKKVVSKILEGKPLTYRLIIDIGMKDSSRELLIELAQGKAEEEGWIDKEEESHRDELDRIEQDEYGRYYDSINNKYDEYANENGLFQKVDEITKTIKKSGKDSAIKACLDLSKSIDVPIELYHVHSNRIMTLMRWIYELNEVEISLIEEYSE